MTGPHVILASGSPRRRDLLASLGISFEVVTPEVDESVGPREAPRAYVARLARAKAATVDDPGALVIAADTTVVLGDDIIGKPSDREDARRMLRNLAGRTHTVHTGVALATAGRMVDAVVDTAVRFVAMSDADIDWYVGTGEGDDKAGAYGMQGTGNLLVDRIEGSPSNVIGLPLATVIDLARQLGIDLLH